MSEVEHISAIIERHWLWNGKQRSKMVRMDTQNMTWEAFKHRMLHKWRVA